MEMRQIRYFLAAARELNFTRAAAACNVSQPSLTRAISLLEGELGGDLFRRERNLTHLTDLGKRLLPLLKKTIENADDAAHLAKSIQSHDVVNLSLALSTDATLEPFVPHLMALADAFPEFDIKVSRGPISLLSEQLKKGDIDILISPVPEDKWERFELWPLFSTAFCVVLREDHPLAAQPEIPISVLKDTSLIHRPYCKVSKEVRNYLDNAGVTLSPAPEFMSDDDLLAYLSSGKSIALLPNNLFFREGLVKRPLSGAEWSVHMHAVTVAGRKRGAALSLLLNQLRAADWEAADAA